jgi:hypothetical protein
MTVSSIRSLMAGAALAALGLALAACSQTTYGTGTAAGMQTLEDLSGLVSLGSPDKEAINYQPRPKIVAPPPGAPLPPPGETTTVAAADWPVDPDLQSKQFKAQVAAREKACAENKTDYYCKDPNFSLPAKPASDQPVPFSNDPEKDAQKEAMSTPEQNARAKKLFADARGNVAVDENGNPIRRYLSDPPPDYRVPDPTAPVEIDNKPAIQKKWKWPWEN